ncbi:helix-turn-helix transcriptional regulator [Dankookia sp. GCM10030260]|uniref:helix-turn-helix transcriptional regulator n=1 Tax=Dankookia sp. GCM10030260 TaxID=3273390 RepID=UPI00360BDAE5
MHHAKAVHKRHLQDKLSNLVSFNNSQGMHWMAKRVKKSKLRDARLQLGLSQAEVGNQLGVTGAAIGHYETGLSKPSPDRAAQLAKLLGLKPNEVDASQRGSIETTTDRRRPAVARQRANHARDVQGPSREEGAVLDALRAMPAAERRVVVKLVLAYKRTGPRTAAGQHR